MNHQEMDEDLPSIAKNYIEVRAPEKNGTGTKTISIYISGKSMLISIKWAIKDLYGELWEINVRLV